MTVYSVELCPREPATDRYSYSLLEKCGRKVSIMPLNRSKSNEDIAELNQVGVGVGVLGGRQGTC